MLRQQRPVVFVSLNSSFYHRSKEPVMAATSTTSFSPTHAPIQTSRKRVWRIQVMHSKTFGIEETFNFSRRRVCSRTSELPCRNNGLKKHGRSTRCRLYLLFLM